MKSFNVMSNQQKIVGHFVPAGAFYGYINLKFTRKVRVGNYRVTDKHGHIVYKDGTEKTRYIYRNELCKQAVYYSVESTKMYRDANGQQFLKAWIAYDNGGNIFWQNVILGENAMTRQLNLFIIEKIDAWCESTNTKWEDIVIKPIEHSKRHMRLTMCPRAKRAQEEFIYNGVPMRNPDDTDVKPRLKIVHTNLSKCKTDAPTHEPYTSPYSWEYGSTPKKSGNIEAVAAMNVMNK